LFTLLKEKKSGHRVSIDGDKNTYWLFDVIENAPGQPRKVKVNQDDTAILMYTGGTTGAAKGAKLTHKNILANAWQGKIWIDLCLTFQDIRQSTSRII